MKLLTFIYQCNLASAVSKGGDRFHSTANIVVFTHYAIVSFIFITMKSLIHIFMPQDRMIGGILFLSCLSVCLFVCLSVCCQL